MTNPLSVIRTIGQAEPITCITTDVLANRPIADGTKGIFYATDTLLLYYDSGAWVTIGPIVILGSATQSVLLTSGTVFNVPATVSLVWVSPQGAGAGAGAKSSGTAGVGGAGAGELIYRRPWVVTPGGTVAYVIGAKGLGGAPGPNNGNDGGATTWYSGALSAAGGLKSLADTVTSGAGGGRLGAAAVGSGVAGIDGARDVDNRGGSSGGGGNSGGASNGGKGGGADQNSGGLGGVSDGSRAGGGGGAASHFGPGGGGGNGAVAGSSAAATSYGAAGGGPGGKSAANLAGGDGAGGCILVEWVA